MNNLGAEKASLRLAILGEKGKFKIKFMSLEMEKNIKKYETADFQSKFFDPITANDDVLIFEGSKAQIKDFLNRGLRLKFILRFCPNDKNAASVVFKVEKY